MAKIVFETCDTPEHMRDIERSTTEYRLGYKEGSIHIMRLCTECAAPVEALLKTLKPKQVRKRGGTTMQEIEQTKTTGRRVRSADTSASA